MNTLELINTIAKNHKIPPDLSKAIVDDIFKIIAESAQHGREITFSGFGKFKVKSKKQYRSTTNLTDDSIEPKTEKQLLFQPSKVVTKIINSGAEK